jgi:hypothetical protein
LWIPLRFPTWLETRPEKSNGIQFVGGQPAQGSQVIHCDLAVFYIEEVRTVGHWYDEVVTEITALIERVATDTDEMWATGAIRPGTTVDAVADDLQAVQYAPYYTDGVWRADAETWRNGNAQAAARYKGKGIRWMIDQVTVLPRSVDEAAVMYRVSHWEPGKEQPAQALFLETWVRQDSRWNLLRHTAEKARPRQG